jgi:molybdate transport system substrate-binding protein
MTRRAFLAAAIIAAIGSSSCDLFSNTGVADAADLKLLSAAVLKPALKDLAPEFERTTGHTLAITYESAGVVRNRIQGGEIADVAIIQKPAVEALAQQGRIVADSVVTLARSGVAVGVPAGRPRPDISSVDALKRSLLAAKSIAYPDANLGHASGIHFRWVLDRLGITKEIDAKAKLMKGTVAEFAAQDSADIVISQPMEFLATPGYELIGWLPEELQNRERFTWAAGIPTTSTSADAARALIHFLSSPTAVQVIKRRGMEPATQ